MRLMALLSLITILALATVTLWRSSWSYAAQDRLAIGTGISRQHMAGTDELGRDRAVRTSLAMLLGVAGSVGASALASLLAVGLGTAAAFASPWIGSTLLYLADLFLTLPWIFLLLMVRAALPLSMDPMHAAGITFLLLGLLGAPVFLRAHYTRTRALRRAEWLLQGRASGLRPAQIARHILPHLRTLLLTQFLLYIPACIIAEANLGTLGLGIGEPLASWGSMLQSLESAAFLSSSRLIYLPIVLLILILVLFELLAFNKGETSQ